jgi:hypothetical protein
MRDTTNSTKRIERLELGQSPRGDLSIKIVSVVEDGVSEHLFPLRDLELSPDSATAFLEAGLASLRVHDDIWRCVERAMRTFGFNVALPPH